TVGNDFAPYAEWMDKCGIPRTHIKELEHTYTGQAFITSDMDDNQITAFHPGAMSFSHENQVEEAQDVTVGIVSPDGREGMIEHARQFAEANIPFIFDPGQGMPMFDGDDLKTFIEQATYITVNDYEMQLLQDRTGLSPHEVTERVEALIVTLGAKGSHIYTSNKRLDIPAAKPEVINDPTGCGDAYRSGLLYGLMNDMDWENTGRVASLMGAIKIEHHGTQNHTFDPDGFNDRFKQAFGYCL
ncbi:MAG: carbohydrate kinase family protein, partial [Granulosicoccaceae bacterium]